MLRSSSSLLEHGVEHEPRLLAVHAGEEQGELVNLLGEDHSPLCREEVDALAGHGCGPMRSERSASGSSSRRLRAAVQSAVDCSIVFSPPR